jgi:hypothetical protein
VSRRDRDKKGTEASDETAAEIVAAFEVLWNALGEIARCKGASLEGVVSDWTTRQLAELPAGARPFFHQLCDDGCHPTVLVAVVKMIRSRDFFEPFWRRISRTRKQIQVAERRLEEAAVVLDVPLFGASAADQAPPGFGSIQHLLPPSGERLRQYGQTITFVHSLVAATGVRSLRRVLMMLLASYVEKATAEPNHVNVSGLISETGPQPYSHEAYRQWRYRHKRFLDDGRSGVPMFTDLLMLVSRVLPR